MAHKIYGETLIPLKRQTGDVGSNKRQTGDVGSNAT
jgi:hypothetical protein